MYLPTKAILELNGFELKFGQHYYLFRGCETPFNNCSSGSIAADKYCTNQLLAKAGIPVPNAFLLNARDYQQGKLEKGLQGLSFPVVLKPLSAAMGLDVLCNIQNRAQLEHFLTQYFKVYSELIIETFHSGLKSYRVLVFNKRVIGVVLREPAKVIGDGVHTIAELVSLSNVLREKNNALGPIKIDDECRIRLQELKLSVDDIPPPGEEIRLCYTSNATRGGTFTSLGKTIHKDNKTLMIKIASLLNLNLTGIDVECEDIRIPIRQSNGVIIEVNHRPSVRIHEFPLQGKPNYVTKKIVRNFIYRHPLWYVHSLFSHQKTTFYARAFLVTTVFVTCYCLLSVFHP